MQHQSSSSAGSRAPSGLVGATYAPLTAPMTAWSSPLLPGPLLSSPLLSSPLLSSPLLRYLRRGLQLSQWDTDYTLYQLIYSCRDPRKVYRLTLHRKQTKNQWARDDPAFPLLICAFLTAAAIAYGIAYRMTSIWSYLWLIQAACFSFVGWGIIICTCLWWLINKYARNTVPLPHSVEQKVEWLYAWDVHCNSFVPILLLIYVLNFFLLPLVMQEGFLATLLGNTVYAAALCHYSYTTFWGYSELPFLQQQKLRVVLLPIAGIAVLYLLFLIFGFNVARFMMGLSVLAAVAMQTVPVTGSGSPRQPEQPITTPQTSMPITTFAYSTSIATTPTAPPMHGPPSPAAVGAGKGEYAHSPGDWLTTALLNNPMWNETLHTNSFYPELCCAIAHPWYMLGRVYKKLELPLPTAFTVAMLVLFVPIVVTESWEEGGKAPPVALIITAVMCYIVFLAMVIFLRKRTRAKLGTQGSLATDICVTLPWVGCLPASLELAFMDRVLTKRNDEQAPPTAKPHAWTYGLCSCRNPMTADTLPQYNCALLCPFFMQARIYFRTQAGSWQSGCCFLFCLFALQIVAPIIVAAIAIARLNLVLANVALVLWLLNPFMRVLTIWLRGRVRQRYDIYGTVTDDAIVSICCEPSVLTQMEIQTRLDGPAKPSTPPLATLGATSTPTSELVGSEKQHVIV